MPNGEQPKKLAKEPRIKSPQEMVDYVHKQNAHLMISIWASFGPWTDQYKELKEMNALIPFDTWPANSGTAPYDPFNEKARDLYGSILHRCITWEWMPGGRIRLNRIILM